jgi:hypothetical protein
LDGAAYDKRMSSFRLPDWLPQAPPPPPRPPVDDRRIENLLNGCIAGRHDALLTAPDAFYRREGGAAIEAQPGIVRRLQELRTATLEQARDDDERGGHAWPHSQDGVSGQ